MDFDEPLSVSCSKILAEGVFQLFAGRRPAENVGKRVLEVGGFAAKRGPDSLVCLFGSPLEHFYCEEAGIISVTEAGPACSINDGEQLIVNVFVSPVVRQVLRNSSKLECQSHDVGASTSHFHVLAEVAGAEALPNAAIMSSDPTDKADCSLSGPKLLGITELLAVSSLKVIHTANLQFFGSTVNHRESGKKENLPEHSDRLSCGWGSYLLLQAFNNLRVDVLCLEESGLICFLIEEENEIVVC